MRVGRLPYLLAAVATLAVSAAHASEGLNLLSTDVQNLGRAGSGAASPRSAYWTILNPAGLTEFDQLRIDTSIYAVQEKIRLKPRGILANPFDGELNADNIVAFPNGGVVMPLQSGRGALGAALYVIGGGKVEYDNSRTWLGKFAYGGRDRNNQLEHIRLAVAYAYEICDDLSIGVGMQGSLTRLRTDQLTLNFRPADANNKWDDAYGIGFNVGIYKKFGEHFALGANYKTPQWTQPHTKYRDLAPDKIEYPQTARIGIAWIPLRDEAADTDKLTFTLDYDFQNWSAVSPFGQRVLKSGLGWSDIHALKAGVEWNVNEKITLMAGVSFSKPVVSNDHAFSNAFIPSLIEQHYTAGITWHVNPNNDLHLVYLRSAEKTRHQTGTSDWLDVVGGYNSDLTVAGNSIAVGYSHKF